MTERPILFSGPMVLAILAGKKTQTRRVCECPPTTKDWVYSPEHDEKWWPIDGKDYVGAGRPCPFGKPGHRLWVREAWRPTGTMAKRWTSVLYRADEAHLDRPYFDCSLAKRGWHPGIHLPRAGSRIDLEITAVRLEPLRPLRYQDALAEGVESVIDYELLWNGLNEKRGFGWSTNPWVWVIEFKRLNEERKAA